MAGSSSLTMLPLSGSNFCEKMSRGVEFVFVLGVCKTLQLLNVTVLQLVRNFGCRIQVHFLAEDPLLFTKRVKQAHEERAKAELKLVRWL
jgi:hypothetical protein